MAKKTGANIEIKKPTKKTKIIRLIKSDKSNKFSFEEKIIDSTLINEFLLKKKSNQF